MRAPRDKRPPSIQRGCDESHDRLAAGSHYAQAKAASRASIAPRSASVCLGLPRLASVCLALPRFASVCLMLLFTPFFRFF